MIKFPLIRKLVGFMNSKLYVNGRPFAMEGLTLKGWLNYLFYINVEFTFFHGNFTGQIFEFGAFIREFNAHFEIKRILDT